MSSAYQDMQIDIFTAIRKFTNETNSKVHSVVIRVDDDGDYVQVRPILGKPLGVGEGES